ncbi:MAG TPA: substrate-binding domain-containing protein [Herpetosiphonaceae bacterium]
MFHRFSGIVTPMSTSARLLIGCWLLLMLAACSSPAATTNESSTTAPAASSATAPAATADTSSTTQTSGGRLRLATTTSTADSGLLDAILSDFEQRYGATVDVVAVGTGQALKLGENGDADVVLVHARSREDAFVSAGFGLPRHDVMYNDFVIVGPTSDPARLGETQTGKEAFAKIAAASALFASRGDDSGTFTKEQTIWSSAGISPTAELSWYKSLGQGMGETLIAADELGAYTLADRGTFLSMRDKLPNLTLLVGGATIAENSDPTLRNPYGVIQVNPARHTGINDKLAASFVEWITSPEIQTRIGEFGRDRFGQPLFYPEALP